MSERSRAGQSMKWSLLGTASVLVLIGAGVVAAVPQQNSKKGTSAGAAPKSQPPRTAAPDPRQDESVKPAGVKPLGPVVATVNGEEITYKALAEEVIARRGAEVLETMISRLLVEQACRERGIKITAQEIDEEIRRTAERLNMTREKFLKMIQDERNISYQQYERDIVWPSLALKKMAKPYVKVSEEDIERGYEAQYGEKVRCRWIMLDDLRTANMVWNELKESDKEKDGKIDLAEFERQVTRWSIDPGSRTLGGQLQPIPRHTTPTFKAIEEAAFALRDDGEISKIIQFGGSFVILYREGRVAAVNQPLEKVRNDIEAQIYEAKMREQIEQIFMAMQKSATIENLLTGDVLRPGQKTVQAEHTESKKSEPSKPAAKETAPPKGAGKK